MKSYLGSLVAVVALVAVSAQGIVRPGWERPILRADLQQLSGGGVVINYGAKKSLTMNRRDGAKDATSLTLVEERQVFCVRAPCRPIKQVRQFSIERVLPAGCGSRRFVALENLPHGLTDVPRAVLTLVDHSKRLCEDFKPYSWEVTLQSRREATRRFGGNPEPVYTIQRD